MGCSLASSLVAAIKKFKRESDPEFLFIEPSEMVIAKEIRDVVLMGQRDVKYEVGPVIALVDGEGFRDNWQERRHLLIKHLSGADAAFISRIDLLSESRTKSIGLALAEMGFSAWPLSTRQSLSAHQVVELIA